MVIADEVAVGLGVIVVFGVAEAEASSETVTSGTCVGLGVGEEILDLYPASSSFRDWF